MAFHYFRRSSKRLKAACAVYLSIAMSGPGLQAQSPALPTGGTVVAGSAHGSPSCSRTITCLPTRPFRT